MKFYVGIDAGAKSFTACVVTREEVIRSAQSFENNAEGIASLHEWMEQTRLSKGETLVAVENTGVFTEALCYELDRRGYQLVLLDPHKVWKAFAEGAKTDPLDSRKIAEYAYRYLDRLVLWGPREAIVEQVKVLLRTREQFVEQKTAAQNSLTTLRRKYIQTPAANAALERTLLHLKAEIRDIEAEIHRLIRSNPTAAQMIALLMTAPGVGHLLASHLFVLTGGFAETPSYRSLAQYLGIAPNAQQSGSWTGPSRSRGYGPSTMRKLLYLAACSLRTHNDRYRQYYLRKVAEGKPKRLVLNNVANRLLRVLCAMITSRQPYIENHLSVQPMLLTKS